tara:strand:+ start:197 stop:958 length:762 start_codon:yes stop_codon:yes gene_type:complete
MRGVRFLIFNSLLVCGLQIRQTIQRMAKYSSKAYMSTEDAKINTLTNLPETLGIRAFFDQNDLIITCRGTSNISDWTTNLNCFLTKHPFKDSGRVHQGYLHDVWDVINMSEFKEIEEKISSHKNRDILIGGHSSAGAKSVIIGHYLARSHPEKKFTVVTFGSPKTGDSKFYKNIESLRNLNIISVNFRDDVVPLLGFGTSKPDRQLDIFSDEKCYHLIKSHLMLRYEEALIHNTELYQLFERKEEDVLRFNIN